MFLASSIIPQLIRILFHVRVCGECVVISTSCYRPPSLIYHSPWHSSVFAQCSHNAWSKNIDIAVGILLISCVQAEIYVISCLLPVPDRHLWFLLNPANGSPVVLLNIENISIAVGILLLSCLQAGIYVITYLLLVRVHQLWFFTGSDVVLY